MVSKFDELLPFSLKHSGILDVEGVLSCQNFHYSLELVGFGVPFLGSKQKFKIRRAPYHCTAQQVNEVLKVMDVKEVFDPSQNDTYIEVQLYLANYFAELNEYIRAFPLDRLILFRPLRS